MFINELPDDCLLIIFGLMNELDDLVNCFKVCSQWSRVILERTREVKYLFEHQYWWLYEVPPSYSIDYVYYSIDEPIDVTILSTLFPDLQIVEFSFGFWERSNLEDIVTWVKKMKALKGLMHSFLARKEVIFQYCNELEMLSTDCIEACTNANSVNIKQLRLAIDLFASFIKNAHHFPNVERLLLYTETDLIYYYDGPIFSRLKMIQFAKMYRGFMDDASTSIYYGFQFMDSCPNLQSAAISLECNRIFVDGSLKHESLQDLVIEFCDPEDTNSATWNTFKILFMKYPNLKHLALRSWDMLTNNHVKQLVRILPNLVLFDVRGCPKVTQKSVNYIQNYNIQHGRTIKFYFSGNYHKIRSDWPQLSTKWEIISQGFDFMNIVFLKILISFLLSYSLVRTE